MVQELEQSWVGFCESRNDEWRHVDMVVRLRSMYSDMLLNLPGVTWGKRLENDGG